MDNIEKLKQLGAYLIKAKKETGPPIGAEDIHTHALPEDVELEDDAEKSDSIMDLMEGSPMYKEDSGEQVDKALTTRDLYIPVRERIQDSALTGTNRAYSAIKGPDGVAPLVGETIQIVEDNERARTQQAVQEREKEARKNIEAARKRMKEQQNRSSEGPAASWYGDIGNYR